MKFVISRVFGGGGGGVPVFRPTDLPNSIFYAGSEWSLRAPHTPQKEDTRPDLCGTQFPEDRRLSSFPTGYLSVRPCPPARISFNNSCVVLGVSSAGRLSWTILLVRW